MAPTLSAALHLIAAPTLAAAFVASAAGGAAAQETVGRGDSAFHWTGRVPAGARLTVHAAHGKVDVLAASGETAEIHATKRGRGDRDAVAFKVVRDGDDVVVCAVRDDDDECGPDGVSRQRRSRDRDEPATDFTIRLPRGVHVGAHSGNGTVTVTGATGDVEARSGNGAVHVGGGAREVEATSGNGRVEVEEARGSVSARSGNGDVSVATAAGPVSASSGNGDIIVRMATLAASGDMEFRTGNGDVRLDVPESFQGRIDASMGHGRFSTDFPITLEGRFTPRRIRGSIGDGSRSVRLSSGNGDIEIRKISGR
ncbi:MAG TPA: DUF4097 family beta strand repeat-containing protein [Gemmatimonadaceae bacterium]